MGGYLGLERRTDVDRRALLAADRRATAAKLADRVAHEERPAGVAIYRAVEWCCHAPTTVVRGEGADQLIVATCQGNGMSSEWNARMAARIAAALNALGDTPADEIGGAA